MNAGALNAPASSLLSQEVESARIRCGLDLGEAYAALLDVAASLPAEAGPSAVARRLLAYLSGLMPDRAFGVCLALPDNGIPLIELSLPDGMPPPGRDPTRLFPELEKEWVLELTGLEGSTLHAAPCGVRVEEEPVERAILHHTAALMAAGVRTALVLRASKPVSVETTELRAQLIQAEKLSTLGQIVAGVVHELANPVTSIVACTDLLMRNGGVPREEELTQLQRIRIAADRILKFSRDLVHYSRPAREAPGPVLLGDIIEQAHAFSQHELERYGVHVELDCGDVPPVLGRAGPLTQIFVNLFTNAAHAMSEQGGRLQVRVRRQDGASEVAIDVTDTGVGIHPETLGKIFEPFFTTKESGQGTGLGLAIVKEIVESHGGVVAAASTPGEGTTFTVQLPLAKIE